MKKLLAALLVVSALGATSCKKDVETTPAKTLKVNGAPNANLRDTGAWD